MANIDRQPNWLLLRGLGRESGHWGDFIQQSQILPGRIQCLDLPGNGRFCREQTPASIPAIVEWLRTHHPLTQPSYIVGLSLGGMLAHYWMQRYPAEVCGTVLINSSMAGLNGLFDRLRPQACLQVISGILSSGNRRENLIFELTCMAQRDRPATISHWLELQQQHPVSRLNVIRQLWAASRYRPTAEPPKRPTLIICSGRDKMVDPDCSTELASHWQTTCLTHPDAGHDLPHDQGDWLAQQLLKWIQKEQQHKQEAII